MTTPGATLQRWIDQARDLGLVVDVTESLEYGVEGISVMIKRPHREPVTMLDVVLNADYVHIYACRIADGEHRFSHSAWKGGYSGATKVEKLSTVRYHIAGLGEDR